MTEDSYRPRDWEVHPSVHADYGGSLSPATPGKPLVTLPHTLSELTGPVFGHDALGDLDDDLIRNAVRDGEPIGERIVVSGRILDENDRPVPDTLIEIWQANAAGRYTHMNDQHDAPLDPNFSGTGRCVSDAEGNYRFRTIFPAPYPLPYGDNLWRPAHIHFSLFGPSIATRLVTQCYFPGDPLNEADFIYRSIPDAGARERLIAAFSKDDGEPGMALGYRFDIVLRGRARTPMETPGSGEG